jgi:hypothetical protein
VSEPTKVCTRCKKEKLLWQFHKARKHKDGLQYTCKQCESERTTSWRKRAKERGIRTGTTAKWLTRND